MSCKRVVLLRSNPVSPDPPVEKVANTLLARGHEVTIVAWDRGSNENEVAGEISLPNGEAKIVRFGIPAIFGGGFKKTLRPLMTFQFRLSRWLKKHREQYDVIHAFDFDTGLVGTKIAKRYNKKLVYHILDFYVDSHAFSEGFLKRKIKKAEINIINNADATIICTEKRREQIAGSEPKNLTVIHNTPSTVVEVNKKTLPTESLGRCKIVYVGILAGSRFIKELMELVVADDRFEFHIGGFGKLEDRIVEAASKCDRIFFHGKLPYSETLALESACDIMTAIYDPSVPNHRYAAPNKFYESLMLGKPIIMVKNTGFDEVVEQKQIGVLIEYSRKGLKAGIEKLISEKQNWSTMSKRSRELYENFYSWDIMAERLNEIYDIL